MLSDHCFFFYISVIVRQMGEAHGPPKMIKTPSRAVYNMLKDEFVCNEVILYHLMRENL